MSTAVIFSLTGLIFITFSSSSSVDFRVDEEYLHAAATVTLTCRSNQTNGVRFNKGTTYIGACDGMSVNCLWTNTNDFYLFSNYTERIFYLRANISDRELCSSFSCTDFSDATIMESVSLYKAFGGNVTISGNATQVAVTMDCVVPSRIFNIAWYYKEKSKTERILYQPTVSNLTFFCGEQCYGEDITRFTQSFEPPVSSDPTNAITVLFEVDIVVGGYSGNISRTLSRNYTISVAAQSTGASTDSPNPCNCYTHLAMAILFGVITGILIIVVVFLGRWLCKIRKECHCVSPFCGGQTGVMGTDNALTSHTFIGSTGKNSFKLDKQSTVVQTPPAGKLKPITKNGEGGVTPRKRKTKKKKKQATDGQQTDIHISNTKNDEDLATPITKPSSGDPADKTNTRNVTKTKPVDDNGPTIDPTIT